MRRLTLIATTLLVAGSPAALRACDLCTGGLQTPPLSQEIARARHVVFGPIVAATPAPGGLGGTCQLRIDAAIKTDGRLKDQKVITLNRYVPVAPNTWFLVFLDENKGQLDDYKGIPFASDRIVKYLREAPPLLANRKPEERAGRLLYFFKYLNDAEVELAADAYKEWAFASNREVGLVGPKLAAADLRAWFLDPKTPANRLGLYAYLLGACGGPSEAELLKQALLKPDERTGAAIDGILAGYIHMNPAEGWKLAEQMAADVKRPFTQRYALLRMLQFYHGFQPEATRGEVLRCLSRFAAQEEWVDLAARTLRQWQVWDLTDTILATYRNMAKAPVAKNAILIYALECPLPQARQLVEEERKKDPTRVTELEAALRFEKGGTAR